MFSAKIRISTSQITRLVVRGYYTTIDGQIVLSGLVQVCQLSSLHSLFGTKLVLVVLSSFSA